MVVLERKGLVPEVLSLSCGGGSQTGGPHDEVLFTGSFQTATYPTVTKCKQANHSLLHLPMIHNVHSSTYCLQCYPLTIVVNGRFDLWWQYGTSHWHIKIE